VKGCTGLDHTAIKVTTKQMEKQAAENKKRRTQTKLDSPLRMADEMTPKYILQYKPKGC
jgi:hypothetical protein